MSRYAYIHTTTWQDKKFRQLSESAKMLYIAMLTAPNSIMIGLYEWPVAYALHDLGDWDRDKFFSCLSEIEGQDMARYDTENEVLFIRSFLKHNPLTSIKQVVGGAKYLKALPRSPLLMEFAKVWADYVEAPFRKSLEGRTDDNAKRSLREIDHISSEIRELLREIGHGNPSDTLSGEESQPSDTPIDNPVPGHGPVPEPVHGNENGPEDDDEAASAADGDVTGTESAEKPVSLGKVLTLWNDTLGPLGFFQVKKVTPARERAFRARLNASSERKAQEWWESVIGKLAVSKFMLDSAKNKANWLTFDWLLSENNIVKVLEGKYDNDRVHVAGNSVSAPREQPASRPLSYAEAMARFERRHGGGRQCADVIDVEAREGESGDAGTGSRYLPEAHGQGGHCHGPTERQGL